MTLQGAKTERARVRKAHRGAEGLNNACEFVKWDAQVVAGETQDPNVCAEWLKMLKPLRANLGAASRKIAETERIVRARRAELRRESRK